MRLTLTYLLLGVSLSPFRNSLDLNWKIIKFDESFKNII